MWHNILVGLPWTGLVIVVILLTIVFYATIKTIEEAIPEGWGKPYSILF